MSWYFAIQNEQLFFEYVRNNCHHVYIESITLQRNCVHSIQDLQSLLLTLHFHVKTAVTFTGGFNFIQQAFIIRLYNASRNLLFHTTFKGRILLNNVKITTYNSMKIEGKLFFFPSICLIAYAFSS